MTRSTSSLSRCWRRAARHKLVEPRAKGLILRRAQDERVSRNVKLGTKWPVHAEQGPHRGARRPDGKARRPRLAANRPARQDKSVTPSRSEHAARRRRLCLLPIIRVSGDVQHTHFYAAIRQPNEQFHERKGRLPVLGHVAHGSILLARAAGGWHS